MYALEMLVIEEEKCHKFEDDLNDHIRAHVIGFFHDDFSKIVTCALNGEKVNKEEYERKERRHGKKTLDNQVLINTGVRNSEDRSVIISPAKGSAHATGSKIILPTPSVASALGVSSRGPTPPYYTHCGRKRKGECWRLTGACLVCGFNGHKVKDCPRARSFTAPPTRVQFQ